VASRAQVEINLAILGEILYFFDEIVGLDANGSGDAFGVGVVVTVAADVGDEHVVNGIGHQSAGEFFGGDARDYVEEAVFAVDVDAVDDIDGEAYAKDQFGGGAGGAESAGNVAQYVAEEISGGGVGAYVENCAERVELQKITEAHFHAAG
jgi:hypothetical protein